MASQLLGSQYAGEGLTRHDSGSQYGADSMHQQPSASQSSGEGMGRQASGSQYAQEGLSTRQGLVSQYSADGAGRPPSGLQYSMENVGRLPPDSGSQLPGSEGIRRQSYGSSAYTREAANLKIPAGGMYSAGQNNASSFEDLLPSDFAELALNGLEGRMGSNNTGRALSSGGSSVVEAKYGIGVSFKPDDKKYLEVCASFVCFCACLLVHVPDCHARMHARVHLSWRHCVCELHV